MSAVERVNILLVDDQPARLLSYEAILGDLGHNVVRASSGPEALQHLMRMEFAVILLDVNMPGMDGFETAQLIHQHPRYEKTPIVFVTAFHLSEIDRLKGYQLGAVDYVFIPIVPAILRSKVLVLVELYLQKRELVRLNANLAIANAELALANSALQAEKARELEVVNRTLAQANDELGHANEHLTAQIAERQRLELALKEADRRKDEFIAMMAHELRTPLAAIVNGLGLLRVTTPTEAEFAWCQGLLDRQVSHLCRLIEDLLDVSRITHDKIKLQRQRLDMGWVVERAIETAMPLVEEHRHRLDVDLPRDPVLVDGDPTRLLQVMGNLINNAVKYTPDGGYIRIRVSSDGAEAIVTVTDNGVGVAPDMLPRLFQLFTQFEPAVIRSQGGLGIGLALVRRLVELHGGRVWARSEGAGNGSEFGVALPRIVDPPALAPAPPKSSTSERVSRTGCRILVVDDNADSAESLGMVLRHLRHEVETAGSGEEAIAISLAFSPQVILLDLGMPGMDGYETARQIRSLTRGPSPLLIALTGWSRSETRDATRDAGFDLHWVKPLDFALLQRLLDELPEADEPVA